MALPTRAEAIKLLQEHVKDNYQLLHAKMVAAGLERYAQKFNENNDLWYITGLLHDLDYFEFPREHPDTAVKWFSEWNYPAEMIQAVAAHGLKQPRIKPETRLAKALIAVDELSGLIYAYFLMRPDGFNGMEPKSVKKKFKDKAFAAKIDREEVQYGIDLLETDFNDHTALLLEAFTSLPEIHK